MRNSRSRRGTKIENFCARLNVDVFGAGHNGGAQLRAERVPNAIFVRFAVGGRRDALLAVNTLARRDVFCCERVFFAFDYKNA